MAQIKYNLGNLGKEVYSTNETIVGTWIDGKTIYRRLIVNNGSFPANSGSGSSIPVSVDFSNVDRVIDFNGTAVFNSMYELPVNYSDAGSNFGVCREILNNCITINTSIGGRSPELKKVFIFMDYTKITE